MSGQWFLKSHLKSLQFILYMRCWRESSVQRQIQRQGQRQIQDIVFEKHLLRRSMQSPSVQENWVFAQELKESGNTCATNIVLNVTYLVYEIVAIYSMWHFHILVCDNVTMTQTWSFELHLRSPFTSHWCTPEFGRWKFSFYFLPLIAFVLIDAKKIFWKVRHILIFPPIAFVLMDAKEVALMFGLFITWSFHWFSSGSNWIFECFFPATDSVNDLYISIISYWKIPT